MAAIHSLLNPLPEPKVASSAPPPPSTPRHLPSPSLAIYRNAARTLSPSPSPQSHKKQKISKDQAVFTRGQIRGECRYTPHEYQDELLAAHHQQFELHPIGEIADFPRHIPYNSEKKMFEGKTGRQCFEVFQYNFRIPGEEKVHCMMWDYNIGLVRTTPLFRCMGYSKTTPAKMLNRNMGLREICHSITGGALVAQGYWMPYEAAKAIAATFCWKMRYALTPVFGIDFPDICLPPDAERYGDMVIDSAITKKCTEEAAAYRLMELESRNASSRDSSVFPSPLTPNTPTHPRPFKQLRPKILKLDTAPPSSGYSTESSMRDDKYAISSSKHDAYYQNTWTPANTPRSVRPNEPRLPSPRQILSAMTPSRPKRNASQMSSTSSELSSPALSPKSMPKRTHHPAGAADEDYDGDSSSSDGGVVKKTGVWERGRMPSDEKAAFLLMGLKLQQKKRAEVTTGGYVEMRGMKRRATE